MKQALDWNGLLASLNNEAVKPDDLKRYSRDGEKRLYVAEMVY